MANKFVYVKEAHKLALSVGKLTEGQARIEFLDDAPDENGNFKFLLFITPNDGLYKGAACKFTVDVPSIYPAFPPVVNCCTLLYHPNIDLIEYEDAPICVSLLENDWQPVVGLDGCVMAVLFLFYQPNLDDPLSPCFEAGLSYEDFASNVKDALRGKEVEGFKFEKLIESDDDEKDENLGTAEAEDTHKDENKTKDEVGSIEETACNNDVEKQKEESQNVTESSSADSKDKDNTAACDITGEVCTATITPQTSFANDNPSQEKISSNCLDLQTESPTIVETEEGIGFLAVDETIKTYADLPIECVQFEMMVMDLEGSGYAQSFGKWEKTLCFFARILKWFKDRKSRVTKLKQAQKVDDSLLMP